MYSDFRIISKEMHSKEFKEEMKKKERYRYK